MNTRQLHACVLASLTITARQVYYVGLGQIRKGGQVTGIQDMYSGKHISESKFDANDVRLWDLNSTRT